MSDPPHSPSDNLHSATEALAQALKGYSESTVASKELDLVTYTASQLPIMQELITSLKSHKDRVHCDVRGTLPDMYTVYFNHVVSLALNMVEKAKSPFWTLRDDLRNDVRPPRATVSYEMRAPVQAYIFAYEDRGVFEKWEEERQRSGADNLEAILSEGFFKDVCEMEIGRAHV